MTLVLHIWYLRKSDYNASAPKLADPDMMMGAFSHISPDDRKALMNAEKFYSDLSACKLPRIAVFAAWQHLSRPVEAHDGCVCAHAPCSLQGRWTSWLATFRRDSIMGEVHMPPSAW